MARGLIALVPIVVIVGMSYLLARLMTRNDRRTIADRDVTIADLRETIAEYQRGEGSRAERLRVDLESAQETLDLAVRQLETGQNPLDVGTLSQQVIRLIQSNRPRRRA